MYVSPDAAFSPSALSAASVLSFAPSDAGACVSAEADVVSHALLSFVPPEHAAIDITMDAAKIMDNSFADFFIIIILPLIPVLILCIQKNTLGIILQKFKCVNFL